VAKAGPRKIARYGEKFKAAAVILTLDAAKAADSRADLKTWVPAFAGTTAPPDF